MPDQPRPAPTFWDIDITTVEGAVSLWHNRTQSDGFGRFSWQVGNPADQTQHNQELKIVLVPPVNVQVNVRWIQENGGDIDVPALFTVPWNPTDAVWQLPTNVSGGFGATDRQVLIATNSAVTATFPVTDVVGQLLNIPLAQFFVNPPANVLIKAAPIQIFGSGSLVRPPGGPDVKAYGAQWTWFTVPQFFGRKPGAAIEYEARMLQVVVVREDAGSDQYMAALEDSSVDGSYYLWGSPFPSRIDYNVAPGVVVNWQWLISPIPG